MTTNYNWHNEKRKVNIDEEKKERGGIGGQGWENNNIMRKIKKGGERDGEKERERKIKEKKKKRDREGKEDSAYTV